MSKDHIWLARQLEDIECDYSIAYAGVEGGEFEGLLLWVCVIVRVLWHKTVFKD